jgi:hypothetical protein
MPRANSPLSSMHSPYNGTVSPFSFVETVEMSPVGESRAPDQAPHSAAPEPLMLFDGLGGAAERAPLDVRLRPLLFTATFWCGLAVLYAFMVYVIVESSSWRGPVFLWALFIPTVVFSLWRRLPAEKARVARLAEEVIMLRCGGYYSLAKPNVVAGDFDMLERTARPSVRRPRRLRAAYAAVA